MKNAALLVFILLLLAACAPQPGVDVVATAAHMEAYVMQTLTAMAVPPTPTLTFTPSPTPTITMTPEPTMPVKRPIITASTGCWRGPGPKFKLISNVEANRRVELLGIGSVPGWYVIRNPYYRTPCCIEAFYLQLDPRADTSTYPLMTPTNP